MTPPKAHNHLHAVPAAIVLFQPEHAILAKLLTALDLAQRRIFLFINGPVGPDTDALIAALSNARILRMESNIGLGAGLNALADTASAEGFSHLLLFDQDSTPEPHMPDALMAHFADRTNNGVRLAMLGPTLTTPSLENYIPIRYAWRDRERGTVDFLPTSGSLLSLLAWREVGPFRADYFVAGIDVEWGFRAWMHGYTNQVDRSIILQHRWGTAASAKSKWQPQILRQTDVRNYFYVRNGVDCLRLQHIPVGWKLRFALSLAAQIGLVLGFRGRALSTRRAMWQALADGWAGRLGPLPSVVAAGQQATP